MSWTLQEAPEGFLGQDSGVNGGHAEAGPAPYLLNRGLHDLNFPGDLPDWNLVPDASPHSPGYRHGQRTPLEDDSRAGNRQSAREASSEEEETLRQRSASSR